MRRSHRASLLENLASLLFFYPYRCRKCGHRFLSARARLKRLRYAHCPRCANKELQRIPLQTVRRRFKTVFRLVHSRAYRCDACRLRFFDLRPPVPSQLEEREESAASTAAARSAGSH